MHVAIWYQSIVKLRYRKVNDVVKGFLDSNFVSEFNYLPQLYQKTLENSLWYFYVAQSGIEESSPRDFLVMSL